MGIDIFTAEGRRKLKVEVLTHYGKNGQLMCCWPDCTITDIDMLSLDHMENNGCELRKKKGMYGQRAYLLAKKTWPDNFQTLCMNHQFKKRALRPPEQQGRPKKSLD